MFHLLGVQFARSLASFGATLCAQQLTASARLAPPLAAGAHTRRAPVPTLFTCPALYGTGSVRRSEGGIKAATDSERTSAPKGHPRIAQRFIAGWRVSAIPLSPVGTTEVMSSSASAGQRFSRPYGTELWSRTPEPSDESLGYSHSAPMGRNPAPPKKRRKVGKSRCGSFDPALWVCYHEYCQFRLKAGISDLWELCDALSRHHSCCSVTAVEHGGRAPSPRTNCAPPTSKVPMGLNST